MPNIFIVEDEPLIAMLLEEWVIELGHTPVGPAYTVAEALKLAAETNIDVAIMDYHIGNANADPVADVLAARDIPFAFASGETVINDKSRHVDRPRLSKPFVYDALDDVLKVLLAARAK